MRRTDESLPADEAAARRGTPIRSISAVVAAYDASETLAALVDATLDALLDAVPAYELIIVDDGSQDATARLAAELAADRPVVRTLRQQRRQGYGAAWRLGIAEARHQYTLLLEASHRYDPGDLARLIQWGDRYELVAGYRIRRYEPLPRRLGSRLFARLVRALLGVSARDVGCAFVLVRTSWLRSLPLGMDGPMLLAEIRARGRQQGLELREVGVRQVPPLGEGDPLVRLRAMIGTSLALLALRRRLRRER